MATAHARALGGNEQYGADVETTADGALITVTAADGSSATTANRRTGS